MALKTRIRKALETPEDTVSFHRGAHFAFNLRDVVRDTITGFQGVVVARTQWLNGCVRYNVTASKLSRSGMVVDETIDEQNLKLVKAAPDLKEKPLGGPRNPVTLQRAMKLPRAVRR